MSWYNYSKRKCINCGYEFSQCNDTLSINNKNYNKCPKCLSESNYIDKAPLTVEEYYKSKSSIYH